jgi:hypothetical protein
VQRAFSGWSCGRWVTTTRPGCSRTTPSRAAPRPRRRSPRDTPHVQPPRPRPRVARRTTAARELQDDTLIRLRRVLGHDHPDTLFSAILLAGDLREQGEYRQARALDEDTQARCRECWVTTTRSRSSRPSTSPSTDCCLVRFAVYGSSRREPCCAGTPSWPPAAGARRWSTACCCALRGHGSERTAQPAPLHEEADNDHSSPRR